MMKCRDFSNKRFRRLGVEPLEERRLLAASVDGAALRSEWPDFVFPENSAELNVIEIAANEISLSAIRSALDMAASTPQDDLILIHTPDAGKKLQYTNANDALAINIDAENFGRVTLLADGGPLALNADSYCRVLTVTETSVVQIGNLTLTGGLATTGIEVKNNDNEMIALYGNGGGIANFGKVTLDDVTVTGNEADAIPANLSSKYSGINSAGGGIYNAGTLSIFRSNITQNTALSGHQPNENEAVAYGVGGGIFNAQGGILSLSESFVIDNAAESETLTISGEGSSVKVEQFGCGGGLYNDGGTLTIKTSRLAENSAWHGGAIDTVSGAVDLTDTLLESNAAVENGGGIFSGYFGKLTLSRCTLSVNTAGTNGGGIYNRSALACENSVFSGNRAGTSGGALYSAEKWFAEAAVYEVALTNVTVTGNSAGLSASGSGGGVFFVGTKSNKKFAQLLITNSIVVQNRTVSKAEETLDENIAAAGTILGENVLSTFAGWSDTSQNNALYDAAIPLFVRDFDFASNVLGDYHLVFSDVSQAIDQGTNHAVPFMDGQTDRDGGARLSGTAIDLGAYETPMSGITPTLSAESFTVQEGCGVYLFADETTDATTEPAVLLIDRDGDGIYQTYTMTSRCFFPSDAGFLPGTYTLRLRTIDTAGRVSEMVTATLNVCAVPPTISHRITKFAGGQVLKLTLNAFPPSRRTVETWVIDWGDGCSSRIDSRSNALVTAHDYTPGETARTYTLTLKCVDSDGGGEEIAYVLAEHTVLAAAARGASQAETESDTNAKSSIVRISAVNSEITSTDNFAENSSAANVSTAPTNAEESRWALTVPLSEPTARAGSLLGGSGKSLLTILRRNEQSRLPASPFPDTSAPTLPRGEETTPSEDTISSSPIFRSRHQA